MMKRANPHQLFTTTQAETKPGGATQNHAIYPLSCNTYDSHALLHAIRILGKLMHASTHTHLPHRPIPSTSGMLLHRQGITGTERSRISFHPSFHCFLFHTAPCPPTSPITALSGPACVGWSRRRRSPGVTEGWRVWNMGGGAQPSRCAPVSADGSA